MINNLSNKLTQQNLLLVLVRVISSGRTEIKNMQCGCAGKHGFGIL
jgi:hypothetical protein